MGPSKLVASTRRQISLLSSPTPSKCAMTPAFVTSPSTRTWVEIASSTSASAVACSPMSPSALTIEAPPPRIGPTTSAKRCACLSPTTRLAPSAAKRSASERPIPEAAPVITAIFPCRRMKSPPLAANPACSGKLLEQTHGRRGIANQNCVIAVDFVDIPAQLARTLMHGLHDGVGDGNIIDRLLDGVGAHLDRIHRTGGRHKIGRA